MRLTAKINLTLGALLHIFLTSIKSLRQNIFKIKTIYGCLKQYLNVLLQLVCDLVTFSDIQQIMFCDSITTFSDQKI